MEVKYSKESNTFITKYSSFYFPIISPTEVEDIKASIMSGNMYSHSDDDIFYNISSNDDRVKLLITYDTQKTCFILNSESFFDALDELATLYESSDDDSLDGETSEDSIDSDDSDDKEELD